MRLICIAVLFVQELPRSESSAWSSLSGLEQLQSLAGAYLLVACAESAAAAAQGVEGAAAGLGGLGLQQQVTESYCRQTRVTLFLSVYIPSCLECMTHITVLVKELMTCCYSLGAVHTSIALFVAPPAGPAAAAVVTGRCHGQLGVFCRHRCIWQRCSLCQWSLQPGSHRPATHHA